MSKPDASIVDSYLVYPGIVPSSWGVCHLRMIVKDQGTLLIASEIRHNPGPSVTNAIEGIWTTIMKNSPDGVLGENPLLVEHYNDEAVYGEVGLGERLALVRMQKGQTDWRHTSPAEVAALAGCAPEDLAIPLDRLIIHKASGGLS
jgi:hypothetical protein